MRRVAILLLPECSNLGLAAVTEPLFVANWLAQGTLFEWCTISVDGKAVRASNGMTIAVDGDLGRALDCASVFVLASFEPAASARNKTLARWLKRIARSGTELVGIENGSLALAEAGLLDDHAAAVHWDNLAGFQELFPRIRISSSVCSFSKGRVTCAGAAAILDMMIEWIGQHADRAIASEVSRHLLLGVSAAAGAPSGSDAVVERARAVMRASVDEPLACNELAERSGFSLRQLERRFKQVLGHGLQHEYMLARVERAHQYLQQTSLRVSEVAALTGFSSVEYFSKVYKRVFGVLPSTDRRQSTDAPVFRAKVEKRTSG